jgi:UDP-N-acetylmuramoyl-L-alanyl-D-glutamate--2,6-diaminopimelate ligase
MEQTIDYNGKNIVMEVSSEGIYYNRCKNIEFDAAILTNISEDHLNTHKSFENYLECKAKLFKQVKKDGISILNIDDDYFIIF